MILTTSCWPSNWLELNRMLRVFCFFALSFSSLACEATNYYVDRNPYPPCTNYYYLGWGGYFCTGSIELKSGDTLSAYYGSTSLTVSGSMILDGNNTIGSSSNTINITTTNDRFSASGSQIYGNISAAGSGVSLTNTNVVGNVSSQTGSVSVSGGSVSGSVSGNGVSVSNGATLASGANGNKNGVSITGSTVSGTITATQGTIQITNSAIPSGTITAGTSGSSNGVPLTISNSTIGSASNSVSVTGNNSINTQTNSNIYGTVIGAAVTIQTGATVYGDVTATPTSWNALSIDGSSQVVGICTANGTNSNNSPDQFPRCVSLFVQCSKPSNIPADAGVTCYCDNFSGSGLSSKILNASWTVGSTGGYTGFAPTFINNRLRLTSSHTSEATSATLRAAFPAAGNYISIEFRAYSHDGSSSPADGIAMVLSDNYVSANPGQPGGSLGYAQGGAGSGNSGFAGGWLGVGFDEYGNFSTSTWAGEGYSNNNNSTPNSVTMRGSYDKDYKHGYPYLGQYQVPTNQFLVLNNAGNYYQVIVDARNYSAANKSVNVQVNRNASCTQDFCPTNYSSIWNPGNVYALSANTPLVAVPDFWLLSYTSSTGASYATHEIGGLRICASKIYPLSGASAGAFNAVDSYYLSSANNSGVPGNNDALRGRIYTKLVGSDFNLAIFALQQNNGVAVGIQNNYVIKNSQNLKKNVTIKIHDDSSSNSPCGGAVVATATQQITYTNGGALGYWLSPTFNFSRPYSRLRVGVYDDSTTEACSTDVFSVRPATLSFDASTSLLSGGVSLSANKTVAAGAKFPATVTAQDSKNTVLTDYTGAPVVLPAYVTDGVSKATSKTFLSCKFLAAVNGTSPADCQYDEVGFFQLSPYAVTDTSYTIADQDSGTQDCYLPSANNPGQGYLNIPDTNDKIGCYFGTAESSAWGRFIPDHFEISGLSVNNRAETNCSNRNVDGFNYMGEPVQLAFTLKALNSAGGVTANYDSASKDANSFPWGRLDGNSQGNWTSSLGATVALSNVNLWGADSSVSPFVVPRILVNGTTVGLCAAPSGIFQSGVGNFSACAQLARGASPDGPYENFFFGVAPTDADKVTVSSSTLNLDADGDKVKERVAFTATKERFGVLRLLSAYGSELLGLNLPMQALYYKGGGFQTNVDDNCTTVGTANVAATTLGVSALSSSLSKLQLSKGQGYLAFTTPSSASARVSGSMDVALDLGNVGDSFNTCVTSLQGSTTVTPASMPWLRGFWGPAASCRSAAAYNQDPNARLRFGSSKAPFIYMRERY